MVGDGHSLQPSKQDSSCYPLRGKLQYHIAISLAEPSKVRAS